MNINFVKAENVNHYHKNNIQNNRWDALDEEKG